MQDEHGLCEFHRVNGTVSTTHIVLNEFKDARTGKTFEYLGCDVLVAMLGEMQSMTEELPDADRKGQQILLAAPDPDEQFLFLRHA